MSEAADAVRRFWETWSGHDHDLRDIIAPGATENGEPMDAAEFQEGLREWREIFSNFTAKLEELIECGDRVVTRVTYSGTHVKAWGPLPASGKSYSGVGIDIFRVTDGRITELWHAVDHLPLVQAIGGRVVPRTSD